MAKSLAIIFAFEKESEEWKSGVVSFSSEFSHWLISISCWLCGANLRGITSSFQVVYLWLSFSKDNLLFTACAPVSLALLT